MRSKTFSLIRFPKDSSHLSLSPCSRKTKRDDRSIPVLLPQPSHSSIVRKALAMMYSVSLHLTLYVTMQSNKYEFEISAAGEMEAWLSRRFRDEILSSCESRLLVLPPNDEQ